MKRESPQAEAKSHTCHNNLSFLFLHFFPLRLCCLVQMQMQQRDSVPP